MFEWAVSQELIPPTVREGVLSVKPIMAGRGGVREGKPVTAVAASRVDAVLQFLTPTLKAMVQVQQLTGMRSGELVRMSMRQIDRTGAIWIYHPERHKTSYRGYARAVPLGPNCRQILELFLRLDPDAPLFSPQEAQRERNEIKRQKRLTKVQPSQISRTKQNPKKQAGKWYNPRSYHAALRYAMQRALKAGLMKREEFWHPHQLRHAAAAKVQHQFGLDGARAFVGHHTWAMTAHYAKRDTETAMQIAAQIG
jgi:integrase